MVSPATKTKVHQIVSHFREKTRALKNGGEDIADCNRIGLMPAQGWRQRNVDFLQNVLIPNMFTRRAGIIEQPRFEETPGHQIGVTWIGHASFFLQIADQNVLIDPNWALWHSIVKRVRRPGVHLHHLPRIDLVLITHAHFDHMHLPSLAEVACGQPIMVPKGVGSLVKRLDFSEIIEAEWWDTRKFGDLEVTFTPARHWGARYVHDVHRGFGGYVVGSEQGSVFHCGDSAYFDGFKEIAKRREIGLALMPIGAYEPPSGRQVHMTPEEAIDSFVDLGAEELVPMHYGTFPLSREPMHEPLERLVDRAILRGVADRVHILDEGQPLLW